jgi:signal transduction histidine kinase
MFRLAKKIAGFIIVGMLTSVSITGTAFANTSTQGIPIQTKEQYYHEFANDYNSKPGDDQVKVATTLEALTAALKVAKNQTETENKKSTFALSDETITQKVKLNSVSYPQ